VMGTGVGMGQVGWNWEEVGIKVLLKRGLR
jgi:hypothetical protein